MKLSSSPMPARVVPRASTTTAAGPYGLNASKTDAIVDSNAGLRLTLRPALETSVSAYFLYRSQPEMQAGTPGPCRKASDLVQIPIVLSPCAEQQVAANPPSERKTQLGPTRRLPLDITACQMVTSGREAEKPRPV